MKRIFKMMKRLYKLRMAAIVIAVATLMSGFVYGGNAALMMLVATIASAVVATVSNKRSIETQRKDITSETLTHLTEQIDFIRQENQQIKTVVEDAVQQLDGCFHQMHGLLTVAGQSLHADSRGLSVVNDAVIALQFEDLCAQLTLHISKRLDAMEALAKLMQELMSAGEHIDNFEHCKQILVQSELAIKELRPVIHTVAHKSVTQHSMASGDVELF